MIFRVDVPLEPGVKLIVVGAASTLRPVAVGATVADSATLPVSPRLLAVIVEVPELVATMLTAAGLTLRVKSAVTVTAIVAV